MEEQSPWPIQDQTPIWEPFALIFDQAQVSIISTIQPTSFLRATWFSEYCCVINKECHPIYLTSFRATWFLVRSTTGYTRKPLINDPIREANPSVPDVFKAKAEQAGQMRLRDDNLVKVIQTALQKQQTSSGQTQTTDKQAQPSNLSWRGWALSLRP